MGVKGLWRLLMPIGRRISIETLEGKILAVDASIWLTQFLSAMRDPDSGKVQPAAHLIGFFRRLCKLRYQGIRPIFVFDGPTPEIKQREIQSRRKRRQQLSHDLSGGAIQRMAKQILVQQLKKRGTHVTAAKRAKRLREAMETPPTMSRETEACQTVVDTTTANGSFAPGFYDPEMETSDTSHAGGEKKRSAMVDEVIEITDDGTDYLNLATSQVHIQSDWDTAVADVDISKSEFDDDIERESRVDSGDIRQYTSANPDDFDPEYVASLPSTTRKDLVEEAQRNRRLQSRREFMKVASDPEGLSKCQLRNFLKSTMLNQNIHKMAREATKKAEGITGTLASDRSKRIIFETESGLDDGFEAKGNKEKSLQKFRENRKLSVMASSDEDSDDCVNWEGGDIDVSNTFKVVASKPKVILDDTSESDEERQGGGFLSPTTKVAKLPVKSRRIQEIESETSDQESTGGSLMVKTTNNHIVAVSDEYQNLEDGTGKIAAMPIRPNEYGDDRVAQGLTDSDEILARVLQEDEFGSDEEGGFLPSNNGIEPRMKDSPSDMIRQVDSGSKEVKSDSGVNWEHDNSAFEPAEDFAGPGFVPVESCMRKIDTSGQLAHVARECIKVNDDDSGTSVDHGRAVLPSKPLARNMEIAMSESDSEGNDVEWQDAEEDDSYGNSKAVHHTVLHHNLEDSIDEDDTWQNNSRKDTSDNESNDAWSYDSSSRRNTRTNANNVSAAFEQAQVTAANLTNWAGRAFRRAVAQHAAENGFTLSPVTSPSQPASPGTMGAAQDASPPTLHAGALPKESSDRTVNSGTPTRDRPVSVAKRKGQNHEPVNWPETLGEEAVMATLEEYQEKWAQDRNHNAQEIETITDEMRAEAMNLLQLFGVPYMEAPAEAEAQCVMLEKLGLVDGIVTEDSDAFVFGGRRIYKNIFDDQKYVEVYDAADAEREMNLTRDSLVALAMLLGGDYTEGVKGVGIVNGMEIIEAFDISQDLKIGLDKFRTWLEGFNPFDSHQLATTGVVEGTLTKEHMFHRKHQSARTRWIVPTFFPDPKVLNAYLNPVVDNSEERFTWGIPDIDRIILFCNKHVGWPADETRKMIQPVIQKIKEGGAMHQTRIESYMRYEDGIKFANVRSKRLRDVFDNVKKQTSSKKPRASSTKNKE